MIDYKLLHALAAVLEHGSFDKAANALHITQSAVSQRIKLLEDTLGAALVVRSSPVALTESGTKLLSHYNQVKLLEDDLLNTLKLEGPDTAISLPLAVNADSLSTWLIDALSPLLDTYSILLDLRIADQEKTHALLRKGEVVGCISSHAGPFQGCSSKSLGTMQYKCCASPEYIARWFAEGVTIEALKIAPAITFDRTDELQNIAVEFLCHSLGSSRSFPLPTHYLPDSRGFVDFCLMGYGYGMLPELQARGHLESGALIDIIPAQQFHVPLYWHHWNLHTPTMLAVTEAIGNHANDIFAAK